MSPENNNHQPEETKKTHHKEHAHETQAPQQAHQDHTVETPKANRSKSWMLFLYIIAGGLIISAVISVAAILVGGIGGVIGKSLLTTLSVTIHALIAAALLQVTPSDQKPQLLVQVVFGVTIGSLVASTLNIWDVVDGKMITNFYQLFLFMTIAASIAQIMLFATDKDKLTRAVKYTTLAFDAGLLLLLLPWIFIEDSTSLPDIYYRGIAALSILLGTSAVLTLIAQMLYRAKHPKQKDQNASSHQTSTGMIVFWVIFGVFIVYVAPFMLIALL